MFSTNEHPAKKGSCNPSSFFGLLELKDISLIRSLAEQIWPKTYAPILSAKQIHYMMHLIYSADSLKQQIKKGDQFIIAYNTGIPVGFASFSEIEPGIYKLHKIYVLQSQQGKGTGKFLIEQVINDIKPGGATILRLNVNRYNSARSFYERLGFAVVRSEDIDIGSGYFMNDYVMEKKLIEEDTMRADPESEILNPESNAH